MNTETHTITVSGLEVEIVRKNIKNLHLGVYPPTGRVRVAVPLRVTNEGARLAVIGKLAWIRRQRLGFEQQAREGEREMVTGESHYFLGRRFRLNVIVSNDVRPMVVVRNKTYLDLHVRSGSTVDDRLAVLTRWYRQELKALIEPLVTKWEKRLKVQSSGWGVKKMKTKWGTCTVDAKRVWFNLELVKKSEECLEYVVAHELAHLIVRHHDERFKAIMDEHIPRWKSIRDDLNRSLLGHELWRK